MTKYRTLIVAVCILLLIACALGTGYAVGSCNKNDDKKYDVTIKIANNYGKEWIFTPDIKELHYEFEYTGEQMKFYVKSYNLPDHPRYSSVWLTPSGEGANVFTLSCLYTDLEGKQSEPKVVLERGNYVFHCAAHATSTLWNYRSVLLNVTVI